MLTVSTDTLPLNYKTHKCLLCVYNFNTDLSFQAAQRVVSSPKEEAMKVLRDISQNFPLQARSLVKTSVSSDLRKEIKKNQKVISLSELFFISLNFRR